MEHYSLDTSISDCDISIRIEMCLRHAEIYTLKDLFELTENQLKGISHLSAKNISFLFDFAKENGFCFSEKEIRTVPDSCRKAHLSDQPQNTDDKKMSNCKTCGCALKLNDTYDALYCPECNEWAEEKCSDPDCVCCANRPDTPIES